MLNCGLLKFKKYAGELGQLTPIESGFDTPFKIKRLYYITKVPKDVRRGFHSHRNLHQVLICLNGSVKIDVFDGTNKETYTLDDSSVGLYIGPMVWREMYDFSTGSVLLVLASELFDEDDYIRDIDTYIKEAKIRFGG